MLSILNLIEADPHSDNVECLIALVKTLRPHLPENGSDAGRSQRPSATPSAVRCRHGENLQTF
ncbi:hypothetical protein QN379_23315, partial [Glaciimonas sp. Gout2]|uniref:hypothetical protein n=1 Tax=Glaciimonas sp. Gout2 TaxID=3048625 RepID=UPI002B22C081